MAAGRLVESDLALLEGEVLGKFGVSELALDSEISRVRGMCVEIEGAVDDAVCTAAYGLEEAEA